ncbi:fungal-specific transcription factor domain-containing protein [Aspergillus cavernicola]|uniref:Fungal-specific transcription factor domain-containing protein n=1 Tax=Aspergillus cavernicola TaxID=176166 RepID=A0ABR4IZP6_9EURO
MEAISRSRHILRKTFACDECKRRKIRCSGDENCLTCVRDAKPCRYSSPSHQLSKLQRRLQECERLVSDMEKAWMNYLPSVDLQEALRAVRLQGDSIPVVQKKNRHQHDLTHSTEQPPTSVAEHSNAEDYEFDESQDFDNSTDGMGFLTIDPHKAGYTGPQSGVAALKFLQSLPLYIPLSSFIPTSSLDDDDISDSGPPRKQAEVARYLDDYFAFYHPAYPILHEGTFRARVSGALAKPHDGSWPLLYNIVLAIGAFAGDSNGTKTDIVFFKEARKHLSMDVLEKGSLSYVQAIVLMANYLQKRNKPNAAFILVGIGFSMALAIGLHREFGMPSTSPFTMEVRRRVWWTLFIFVSGVQLILGRPAVSLVGVNVRLPANVDDHDLAVDMEELPESQTGPTITSCLIAHVKLAKIANAIQVELLTHHLPTSDKAGDLEHRISSWYNDLPAHFNLGVSLEPRFDIPRRVVLWRSYHLRIVINRPLLFQNITSKSELNTSAGPIASCLAAADTCVTSICEFLESTDNRQRGLTWYATCWLLTASFVQASCYVYEPTHPLADSWRCHIQRAVDSLGSLGSSHDMALRARAVLQKVLEHGHERTSPGSFDPFSLQMSGPPRPPWTVTPYGWGENTAIYSPFSSQSLGGGFRYPQGSFGAEFLDAAGGFMIQNLFGGAEERPQNSSWTPG